MWTFVIYSMLMTPMTRSQRYLYRPGTGNTRTNNNGRKTTLNFSGELALNTRPPNNDEAYMLPKMVTYDMSRLSCLLRRETVLFYYLLAHPKMSSYK